MFLLLAIDGSLRTPEVRGKHPKQLGILRKSLDSKSFWVKNVAYYYSDQEDRSSMVD